MTMPLWLAAIVAAPIAWAAARWLYLYDLRCDEHLGSVSEGHLTRLREEQLRERDGVRT